MWLRHRSRLTRCVLDKFKLHAVLRGLTVPQAMLGPEEPDARL